jgi:ankyrin repeat protein
VGCGQGPEIPLIDAVRIGNLKAVKRAVKNGQDVNAELGMFGTPLHTTGDIEIAKFLIANGADVNRKNKRGESPLFYASGNVLELLISEGANVNSANLNGNTPLFEMIKLDAKKSVALLISKGAKVNVSNNEGLTPLHIAVKNGYLQIAEILVSKSAGVNVKDNEEQSPLDYALYSIGYPEGHPEIVSFLRKKGAKSGGNHKQFNSEQSVYEVELEIEIGTVEMVENYLTYSENVNANSRLMNLPISDTLLHDSIYHGKKEIVELLISKGADVNAFSSGRFGEATMESAINTTHKLYTPLDYAIKYNKTNPADLLRKHGGKTSEELKAEGK